MQYVLKLSIGMYCVVDLCPLVHTCMNVNMICLDIGCIQVLPLANETPFIGVGYNSVFHAFLPWSMSVIAYSHQLGYLLVLEKFYNVLVVEWNII